MALIDAAFKRWPFVQATDGFSCDVCGQRLVGRKDFLWWRGERDIFICADCAEHTINGLTRDLKELLLSQTHYSMEPCSCCRKEHDNPNGWVLRNSKTELPEYHIDLKPGKPTISELPNRRISL